MTSDVSNGMLMLVAMEILLPWRTKNDQGRTGAGDNLMGMPFNATMPPVNGRYVTNSYTMQARLVTQ